MGKLVRGWARLLKLGRGGLAMVGLAMLLLLSGAAGAQEGPSTGQLVLERFRENFSDGLAGRTGGLVAVQLGQRMRELASGFMGPALSSVLPGPIARIAGGLVAEFTTTAVSKVGFDLATDLYKRKLRGQVGTGVDLGETVAAAAGSTIGTAILSAFIGPLAGKWLGGWLGWNVGVALLKQARSGKAANIGAALATLSVPRMLMEQAAVDSSTKLSRQVFSLGSLSALASSPIGTPVQFVATLVFASFGSALALALYDTAMAPSVRARGSELGVAAPSGLQLINLKSALDEAYTRYVSSETEHGPFSHFTREAMQSYVAAQKAYRTAMDASLRR